MHVRISRVFSILNEKTGSAKKFFIQPTALTEKMAEDTKLSISKDSSTITIRYTCETASGLRPKSKHTAVVEPRAVAPASQRAGRVRGRGKSPFQTRRGNASTRLR